MRKAIFLFMFSFSLVCQGQTDTVYVKQWDVLRGIDGALHTFTSPVRWKGKDWLTLGGVVAGTAAISLLDEPIRDFWQRNPSEFMDGFERVGYHYGKPYTSVSITGGVYLAGIIFKNEWAKETGLMLATGLGTSSILTGMLKSGVGRARPYADLGNYAIDPLSDRFKYHSLPSGHTSTAMTVSLVMARQVKPLGVKILFYSLAGCTAVSRIYADAHWTSDIALGGTIAWFCADAAMKRISANRYRTVVRQNPVIVKMYPYPGGLTLRASW